MESRKSAFYVLYIQAGIFGSLIYCNSKDHDGYDDEDDREHDYEIVCKFEIFAHAFCMRTTFDNRSI